MNTKNHVIFLYEGFNKYISYLSEIKENGHRFYSADKEKAILFTFEDGNKIKLSNENLIFAF
jgi:hypothetical protein